MKIIDEDTSIPPAGVGDWDGDGLANWALVGSAEGEASRIHVLATPDLSGEDYTLDAATVGTLEADADDALGVYNGDALRGRGRAR